MDIKVQEYWDNIHSKYSSSYDGWLDKHKDFFNTYSSVVELGCGRAYNSIQVKEWGVENIIVTDISQDVLEAVAKEHSDIKTLCFDMLDGIPLKTRNTDIVIADLSLHYFASEQLKNIMMEIRRILSPGGKLLVRVNSSKDTLHMPSNKVEGERNLYRDGAVYKKFFDEQDIEELCLGFTKLYCEEKRMDRYVKPKILWELALEKE